MKINDSHLHPARLIVHDEALLILRMCDCASTATTESTLPHVNYTEEVTIMVYKNNEIITRLIRLRMTSSPQLKQPLHLTLLIISVKVKMQPVPAHKPLRNLIQRDIRTISLRITKNYPAAFSRLPWNIMKSLLPKRQHFIKVDAINDNGANLQSRFFMHFRSPIYLPLIS
jgi:hypothetical protein